MPAMQPKQKSSLGFHRLLDSIFDLTFTLSVVTFACPAADFFPKVMP